MAATSVVAYQLFKSQAIVSARPIVTCELAAETIPESFSQYLLQVPHLSGPQLEGKQVGQHST